MRNYLQVLLGILAAILGWNVSQIFLVDLAPLWKLSNFTFFLEFPYLVKFIILTIFLSIGMVISEIFLSHPTRLKASLRIVRNPVLIAVALGLLAGLLSSLLSWLIKLSPAPPFLVRFTDWLIIGLAVGTAEATGWYVREIFRKDIDSESRRKRFIVSSGIGMLASLVAFVIPVGHELGRFILLGAILGASLSSLASPNSEFVLKAGSGFEERLRGSLRSASIKSPLTFTIITRSKKIEEGLSINLPKGEEVIIGSDDRKCQIYVSDLPQECAKISLKGRQTWLEPLGENGLFVRDDQIEIRPSSSPEDKDKFPLRHNQIVTFYTKSAPDNQTEIPSNSEDNSDVFAPPSGNNKIYVRFVFYDRFLDPEA
jgi:hypothetical protein